MAMVRRDGGGGGDGHDENEWWLFVIDGHGKHGW